MFERGIYNLSLPDRLVVNMEELCKERGIKRVLDLGCGTGRHLVFFSERGYMVYGLDISRNALDSSKRLLEKGGFPAYLLLGDMSDLPYKDESFDMVLGWRVIHLNTKSRILKTLLEVERVLKPSGIFYGSLRSRENTLFYLAREQGEEIEDGTFVMKGNNMDGLIYHFFKKEEVLSFFKRFNIIELYEAELEHTSYTEKYVDLRNHFWIILCEKRN